MTPRERLWAAICGESVDQIPAFCRIDSWYQYNASAGTLPAPYAHMSLPEFERALGFGRSARRGNVFEERLRDPVSCQKEQRGEQIITTWHTPAGSAQLIQKWTDSDRKLGLLPTISEYPIKSYDDYRVYMEVMRHTEFLPCYEHFCEYDRQIGQDGLPLTILGTIPFHHLLVKWVGYEQGYFHLFDRPDIFLEAVETGNALYRSMWPIVAESPTQFVMHGVNFDSGITSPPMFQEHFLPYLKEFNAVMHQAGKKTAFHADGNMKGLLEHALQADYDVADCFACDPMVSCTFAEARSAWKDRITIWGGVPSTLLEANVPLEQLQQHLKDIYQAAAPGDRFVLGIADQAMPTSQWAHIELLSKWACADSHDP